jgi:hypothetical protein
MKDINRNFDFFIEYSSFTLQNRFFNKDEVFTNKQWIGIRCTNEVLEILKRVDLSKCYTKSLNGVNNFLIAKFIELYEIEKAKP